MVKQDDKRFLLSGLFSIGFFFTVISITLLYSYNQNRVIQVRTEKENINVLLFTEPPKPKEKIVKNAPEKREPIPVPKPKPKPKPVPPKPKPKPVPPKPIEVTKKEQQVISPKRENPTPKPQSLSSLFDSADIPGIETVDNSDAPQVSSQALHRLRNSLSKTSTPVAHKEDVNYTSSEYKIDRENLYKESNLVLQQKDIEITSANIDSSERGLYSEFYSKVKDYLYDKWQPSREVAGNKAKVRFQLSKDSQLQSYKVLIYSGSERFNSELDYFLERLKGSQFPVAVKEESLAFEVFIGAKE
jgi:outer membrane biosynthesis protein TonB